MALLNPQLERFLSTKLRYGGSNFKTCSKNTNSFVPARPISQCSAIAIDAPSSLADAGGIRLGSTSLQGAREEMEDKVIIRSDGLVDGFSFAGVFDGHGGIASVNFLRDEFYKECVAALQGGLLLTVKDFNATRKALVEAFENVDKKLSNLLETVDGDESGSTATVMFIGNNKLIVSHIGDSCLVLSRSGKAEVLTESHRPYGSNKVSLQEIKRIREAGGWIVNGRICGDIAVSRAFGDIRFKSKKNEMLRKGVDEGRWTKKFISRVQFNGDLMTASPDVFQVPLGSDAEFVMLASDGLWDYMNSLDAVSFVRNRLRKHGDVQLASEELAHKALDLRSQDNISIVIADLGKTDWQNLPLQQQNVLLELGQAFATIAIVSLGIWLSSQLSL
ncbi:protein phosphatase 2C 57 [Mercurialis annua]|uniref:protein phosphatase 2C 57 n=1 Tax=Mercurialis annua TaxID=3986 RepID=UPI00215FB553|nr:protein phosphatase 2C 57 [Mercurialis annua]